MLQWFDKTTAEFRIYESSQWLTGRSVDDVESSSVSGVDENQLLAAGEPGSAIFVVFIGCSDCSRRAPVWYLERIVPQLRVEEHLLCGHVDRRLHAARCRRVVDPPCLRSCVSYTASLHSIAHSLLISFRQALFNTDLYMKCNNV